ncbi:MAG TPA: alpha/beta hydrolase [Candidatus Nanoarchaeia archaeon]|nr:alpha/beta hydrolase [Candidatus Nanoarchaeia archaeon]
MNNLKTSVDAVSRPRLPYASHGRGKRPILFLHGLNTDLSIWKGVLPHISSKYKCWALQLPTYGEHKIQHYTQLIKEFTRKHGLQNPILVGQSLGAYLALQLIQEGFSAQKLILIAPPLIPRISLLKNWTKKIFRYLLHHARPREFLQRILHTIPTTKELLRLAPLHSWLNAGYDVLRKPFRIPQLQKPTLLIYGKQDLLVKLYQYPYEQLERIRNKKILKPHLIVTLEKANHYIPNQRPRTLAKIINRFLHLH